MTMLVFTRQRHRGVTTTSAVRYLALGDQVLGDLGLSLQPSQPRLLVQAGHVLARGWTSGMTADVPCRIAWSAATRRLPSL
jgi:hypothetical protein